MKKKWIVVIVLVIVAVGIAGYFIGQGGLKSEEEKITDELFPKVEDVSSAPDLKYVEPSEAQGKLQVAAQLNKEHWEQLQTLSLEVRIKNNTDQKLVKTIVTYTIIDKSGQVIGSRDAYGVGSGVSNIAPGEVGTANLEMLFSGPRLKEVARVEYSLRDIQFASSPEEAEKPKETKTPEDSEEKQEEPTEEGIYYAAPQDPKTAEEAVVAFAFLCDQERYEEAEEFLTEDFLDDYGSARQAWLHVSQGERLEKVEIIEVYGSPTEKNVEAKLYFEDGSSFITRPGLIKRDGKWKLDS